MIYPNDLAHNEAYQRIFVADYNAGRVWIITLDHQVNQFNADRGAWTLSVTPDGQVLVVGNSGNTVTKYNQTGQVTQMVDLAALGFNSTEHVVETSTGTWILTQADSTSGVHRVCEINSQGELLKSYGGQRGSEPGQLNLPVHIAVDQLTGRVFVADAGNHRVLMFDDQLTLLGIVLIVATSNLPWRLSFDSGTLVIGLTGTGKTVLTYHIPPPT